MRLRVMIPVSVRADDQRGALGNKVSAMFVSLPVDTDPAGRTAAARSRSRPADLKEQAAGASAPTS